MSKLFKIFFFRISIKSYSCKIYSRYFYTTNLKCCSTNRIKIE